MSVSVKSKAEISNIASNLYREFSEFIFSYQERQVAKQEAVHELAIVKKGYRDELEILIDNYRWFFERIALANKLQSVKRYTKYGESHEVRHEQIDVLAQTERLSLRELKIGLELLHYNSDIFLNQEDEQRLLRYIKYVADRIIQLAEIKVDV